MFSHVFSHLFWHPTHLNISPPAPPGPRLLPTRECYGQALLRAERFAEAEGIFRQALEVDSFHAEPKPGRSLK